MKNEATERKVGDQVFFKRGKITYRGIIRRITSDSYIVFTVGRAGRPDFATPSFRTRYELTERDLIS